MNMAKNRGLWITLILLLVLLLVAAAVWYFIVVDNIADFYVVEAGDSFSAEDFKIRDIPQLPASFATDMSAIDLSVPGKYPVVINYYYWQYETVLHLVDTAKPAVTTKSVTLFATQQPEPMDFIDTIDDFTAVSVDYAQAPDMTIEGTQQVQLAVTDLGGNVTKVSADLNLIFDRQAPEIHGVENITVYVGKPVELGADVTVTDDLDPAPVLTMDADSVDQEKAGEYTVTYTAVDICGNETVETSVITVIHDTQAPTVFGVNKLETYVGSTVSYRNGIVVTDDYDAAPVLTINNSQVNLEEPGTYDFSYIAADAAGNETEIPTTITVVSKPSSFVEEAEIYAKADELLSTFITEDMDAVDQVNAVYNWVTRNCYYNSNSDTNDRLQAAYVMMTRRSGDCYNFYAVTSVFFERLGLPELMVQRAPNSGRRATHFWNMVSVDGGENYYHVDTCLSVNFSDRICLATDALLARISAQNYGYFAMTEGVYPPTPEEGL